MDVDVIFKVGKTYTAFKLTYYILRDRAVPIYVFENLSYPQSKGFVLLIAESE